MLRPCLQVTRRGGKGGWRAVTMLVLVEAAWSL